MSKTVKKKIDASGGYGIIDPEQEVMVTSNDRNVPKEGRVLKIGIIGVGAIAQRSHIPNFQKVNGAEILAVCDPIERKAKLVVEKWGIKYYFTNYKDLFSLDELDAVSVCTPNYLHAPITIDACDKGKHVLCEKPIATTLEDAQRMIDAAKRNKVKLEIGQFKKFMPVYEVGKETLEGSLIGDVLTVRTKLGHSGPEDWSPTTGKWFFKKWKTGMGVLLDLGTKHISLIRWFLNDEVESVIGRVDILTKAFSEVEDYAVGVLKFKSGIICVLETSWCTKPSFKGTEIVGTKGTLFMDYPNTRLEIRIANKINATFHPGIPEESKKGKPFQRFVDCIKEDRIPDVTAEDEKRSLEVALAISKSSETGKTVHLLLDN